MNKSFVIKMFSIIGNGTSILGLGLNEDLDFLWRSLFLGVGFISMLWLIYVIYTETKVNERICHNTNEIESVMEELIKSQGRIGIMSRDLSWVSPKIEVCLADKKDDILILVQEPNDKTEILQSKGIRIKFYGKGFEPQTRFTIIRYNRNNPQVAIAFTQNKITKTKDKFVHKIYQTTTNYSEQDQFINSLATDMIRLCDYIDWDKLNETRNT